ncbi:MAG: N-6 DNA methylase [Actinomycetota bacterium]|nr:N-6 DNA methylase [Actinomycetota bacterium]
MQVRALPSPDQEDALDDIAARKARGAFFTPPLIVDFLTSFAVRGDPSAKVLDPTCGDGEFLLSAAERLSRLGCDIADLDERVFGIDIDGPSLQAASTRLEDAGFDAHLLERDLFEVPTPEQLGCPLPQMDAVVGNPPFVRYQEHSGPARKRSVRAALQQGVRLSGLASSWASVLVHASAFLRPEGRLAIVLPAELLTVHYAEPIRLWLRRRFGAVTLVMFERLQFEDALEKVVLVLAHGSGGCESFQLAYVHDAEELATLGFADGFGVTPADTGKWTDLLLPLQQRRLFREIVEEHFVTLQYFGNPELGTVTGANDFFALNEETRQYYGLSESDLTPISPPGTRHLKGLSFTKGNWTNLRDSGERVWLLNPSSDQLAGGVARYVAHGQKIGIDSAYKCQIRTPWWRPPEVSVPDLFFTYMSHRYPRLIANTAGVRFLNSMHGVRFQGDDKRLAMSALPLLCLNSVTMLGAEVHGRSYGGGLLKMEPREAAMLPTPAPAKLYQAWQVLKEERGQLDRQLRAGTWTNVVKRVDEVLLHDAMELPLEAVEEMRSAAGLLRKRRLQA